MKIIGIILSLLAIAISPQAYSAENKLKFRVVVFVSADESIKGIIESYLSRELTSLGDVILSKEEYEYDLSVLVMKLHNKDGRETGIVLSDIIHKKFDNQFISFMFNEENKKLGLKWTDGLYYYPKLSVRTGSKNDLQSICQAIIADFDSSILQKRRDSFQKAMNAINKIKKSINK